MELMEIEERLTEIMTREISLFSLYKEEFCKLKRFIIDREWLPLQRSLEAIKNISAELEEADRVRDYIYRELLAEAGGDESESFYTLVSRIYGESSKALIDEYRMIRHEARTVKVLNEGFNRYLSNRRNLIKEIMEELIPESRGSIYNKRGIASQNGSSSSLVLNKHL